jgi:hypothetical protein
VKAEAKAAFSSQHWTNRNFVQKWEPEKLQTEDVGESQARPSLFWEKSETLLDLGSDSSGI